MKYLTFDIDNRLSGRYDSDIPIAIPEGAIEITDEIYNQTLALTEGTWELVDDVVTYIPPEEISEQQLIENTVNEWKRLFRASMDSMAAANEDFYNLPEAMGYASVTNTLQVKAVSMVEWSSLARVDARQKFDDLVNGVTTIDGTYGGEYINFFDSLPQYTAPGQEPEDP